MKFLIFVSIFTLLAGCASTPTVNVVDRQKIEVPANLTTQCDLLQPIDPNSDMGDFLKYTLELMATYNECALRHEGLVNATKQDKK